MIKKALFISAVVAAAGVVAVVVLAVTGVPQSVFGSDYAIPPCDQLPVKAVVSKAIQEHPVLVGQLGAASGRVRVEAGSPCAGTEKSVVVVHVRSSDDEDAVNKTLGESEGFGVPVTIQRD